jgi:hypothetical protein
MSLDPISPISQVSAAAQALQPAASHDAAGAKLFADLLRGAELRPGAPHARASAAQGSAAQGSAASSSVGELLQQVSELQSTADPIKAQYVMLDVFGSRMEALSRLHITVALGSGATNIFKQLFNRHD